MWIVRVSNQAEVYRFVAKIFFVNCNVFNDISCQTQKVVKYLIDTVIALKNKYHEAK